MAPAWCVRTTTNADEATCRWTDVEVQMMLGLDFCESEFQPTLKKRRFGGKTTGGAKKGKKVDDAVVETKVVIPVLVNHMPLRDGGELLLYKAKAAPRPRAPVPITMQSLVRNIRMAKASAAAAASGKAASAAAF